VLAGRVMVALVRWAVMSSRVIWSGRCRAVLAGRVMVALVRWAVMSSRVIWFGRCRAGVCPVT
jgi:hypothetical protein